MSDVEFTGHVSAMRADSEYFGAEDFMGKGDVPAKIVKCIQSKQKKACGTMQREMFTLVLEIDGKEASKRLWIKPTNRKTISKMYTTSVLEWKGKWIWMFVEECRSPQGGMTFGIRIRERTDAPKQQAQQQPVTAHAASSDSEYLRMKALWKDMRVMNHQPVTQEAFSEFVVAATDGVIAATDALKVALFSPDLLAKCSAVIHANWPEDIKF